MRLLVLQDKAEEIVIDAVNEAKEYYKNNHQVSDQPNNTNQSEEEGLRLDQIDSEESFNSAGNSFTVDDIVVELEKVTKEQASASQKEKPPKPLEKRKSKEG